MTTNKVILIGNVGKSPEIRNLKDGKKIASFSLATNEKWKDNQSGEKIKRTEWHKIIVYSQGLVKFIEQYINKGSKLYIEGKLQTRKWIDQQGIEKHVTEVAMQGFNCNLQIIESQRTLKEDEKKDNVVTMSIDDIENSQYLQSGD